MEPKLIVMSFNEYCALHNVKSTNPKSHFNKHAFQKLKCPPIPISFITDSHSFSTDDESQESQKSIDMNVLQRTYTGVDNI
eukprot:UN00780